MTTDHPLRDFLTSRRAALEPEAVGLPPARAGRRVRGLRREEVAILAGVSVDYYVKLEQGRAGNVSEQVIRAVERALRLDHLERLHLRALLDPDSIHVRRIPPITLRARPALISMIEALDPVPAVIHGPHLEVLGINRAGVLLLDDFDAMPSDERNMARWMFLSDRAREVYRNWDVIAPQMVAILRNAAAAGSNEYLSALVDHLTAASEEFARYWADYELFEHTHGVKLFFNEAVGDLRLNYEALPLPADHGQTVIVYTADRGSPSAERLRLMSERAEAGSGERAEAGQVRGPRTTAEPAAAGLAGPTTEAAGRTTAERAPAEDPATVRG
ncbi:helix-turn-helix transcriptional regulator [Promicromonospora sukumoe]|uniref:helix-turn-helix transcriptional regulator n=1 Tax=Promicromonospora sukumoe TaxID=88382 RepID=UPI0037C747FC